MTGAHSSCVQVHHDFGDGMASLRSFFERLIADPPQPPGQGSRQPEPRQPPASEGAGDDRSAQHLTLPQLPSNDPSYSAAANRCCESSGGCASLHVAPGLKVPVKIAYEPDLAGKVPPPGAVFVPPRRAMPSNKRQDRSLSPWTCGLWGGS